MISVNGKIPAGSVTLNPTELVLSDRKILLEKCPDKNAEIVYNSHFEKLSSSKQTAYDGPRSSRLPSNHLTSSLVSGYNFAQSNVSSSYLPHSSSNNFEKLDKLKMKHSTSSNNILK